MRGLARHLVAGLPGVPLVLPWRSARLRPLAGLAFSPGLPWRLLVLFWRPLVASSAVRG